MSSQWDGAMRLALDQASAAAEHGDVPIGAVILDPAGKVIAVAGNQRELYGDPTAHAEILVIREAARQLKDWGFSDIPEKYLSMQ